MHLHPHRTLIGASTLTLLALAKRSGLGRALTPRHRIIPLALLIASGCGGVDDAVDLTDEALGAAVAASDGDATLACDWSPHPGYSISSVTFEIDPGMDAAPASEDMEEKCRVSESYATRHGLAGVQLRITVNGRAALCTVDDAWHDRPEAQALVLMSTLGFQSRFGTTTSPQTGAWTTYPVSACGWVAQPLPSITSTPDTAIGIGDFYAAPTGGPAARRVAFTAPHGGGIEAGTWEQVQHLHSLHAASAHFWLVRSVGNSARRWHVNSDDLSFKSFRGLHELHEGFSPTNGEQVRDQVVGFHGYTPTATCRADALIGGGAPLVLRQGLVSAAALWATYRGVAIDAIADFTGTTRCPRGVASENYANELSDFGEGIHIEQSMTFKDSEPRRNALAEAVARYLLAYNETQLTPALGGEASSALSDKDVGLGATWTVPNGTRVGSGSAYGTCQSSGDRGHVDWFVREGAGLLRAGGGALVCNGSHRFEPDAGFQPVSYLNSTGAPVKVRVVGVAYTKNMTAASIQLKATLGAI
ncbi:poly-gamma-glutamate hydrolase family protein [Sorangium sp. So ce1182]|uniref:poly-gamma-glutamate hydrolase family protein n=1 Tax=Sorangium sp. So ce1182 TaxID=3133334 RepID=UPI003F5FE9F6